MRVEIINTGTELLLGRVTNTHLNFLAQSLFGLGLRVERQVTVPDGVAIAEALETAMARADLIVITADWDPPRTTSPATRRRKRSGGSSFSTRTFSMASPRGLPVANWS